MQKNGRMLDNSETRLFYFRNNLLSRKHSLSQVKSGQGNVNSLVKYILCIFCSLQVVFLERSYQRISPLSEGDK